MGKIDKMRTARSMGIEWLDHNCPCKPSAPYAHHLEGRINIDGGSIYICKYCGKAKWMPHSLSDCHKLEHYQKYYGNDEGYCKLLDEHPAAREALAALRGVPLMTLSGRIEWSSTKSMRKYP